MCLFNENMSKKSVESRGDTDVQIVRMHSAQLVSLRIAGVEQILSVKANGWRNRQQDKGR